MQGTQHDSKEALLAAAETLLKLGQMPADAVTTNAEIFFDLGYAYQELWKQSHDSGDLQQMLARW